jgi:hypothetical protein
MVTYAKLRAERAVYEYTSRLLLQTTHSRDEIAHAAVGLLGQAARTIEKALPSSLHPFVGAEDVAYIAAALAVQQLEGIPVLGIALDSVAQAAMNAYSWTVNPNEG